MLSDHSSSPNLSTKRVVEGCCFNTAAMLSDHSSSTNLSTVNANEMFGGESRVACSAESNANNFTTMMFDAACNATVGFGDINQHLFFSRANTIPNPQEAIVGVESVDENQMAVENQSLGFELEEPEQQRIPTVRSFRGLGFSTGSRYCSEDVGRKDGERVEQTGEVVAFISNQHKSGEVESHNGEDVNHIGGVASVPNILCMNNSGGVAGTVVNMHDLSTNFALHNFNNFNPQLFYRGAKTNFPRPHVTTVGVESADHEMKAVTTVGVESADHEMKAVTAVGVEGADHEMKAVEILSLHFEPEERERQRNPRIPSFGGFPTGSHDDSGEAGPQNGGDADHFAEEAFVLGNHCEYSGAAGPLIENGADHFGKVACVPNSLMTGTAEGVVTERDGHGLHTFNPHWLNCGNDGIPKQHITTDGALNVDELITVESMLLFTHSRERIQQKTPTACIFGLGSPSSGHNRCGDAGPQDGENMIDHFGEVAFVADLHGTSWADEAETSDMTDLLFQSSPAAEALDPVSLIWCKELESELLGLINLDSPEAPERILEHINTVDHYEESEGSVPCACGTSNNAAMDTDLESKQQLSGLPPSSAGSTTATRKRARQDQTTGKDAADRIEAGGEEEEEDDDDEESDGDGDDAEGAVTEADVLAVMARSPRLVDPKGKGVTWHKKNKVWEAHLWVRGVKKQLFLGSYNTKFRAQQAHDRAAIRFDVRVSKSGKPYGLNFCQTRQAKFITKHWNWSKRDVVWKLRHSSNKFTKGRSRMKGVTVSRRCKRQYEARILKDVFLGRFADESDAGRAYDKALLFLNSRLPEMEQLHIVTNFRPSSYSAQDVQEAGKHAKLLEKFNAT